MFLAASALGSLYVLQMRNWGIGAVQGAAIVTLYSALIVVPWHLWSASGALWQAAPFEILWQVLWQGVLIGCIALVALNHAIARLGPERSSALVALGYVEARDVYINSEGRRAIFHHPLSRIHLDVFYDRLEFCHVIPLAGRLEADVPTLPLAELLLSKLQIVKLNEKDVIDTILLLLDHPLGDGDADTIDVGRIAALCADDWGLWRTLTMNLKKTAALAASYAQLSDDRRARAADQVARLKQAIDAVPKSFGWRMRDRVGDRRQWWTDVDEVR